MHGTIVGVLRGGPSREHDISLLTGHAIISNLPRDRYTIRDIYIDKAGNWFERGKPGLPADILRTIDVAIIALHGEFGEDGEVQRLLEKFGIPFTGSDSLSSRVAMHKAIAKEHAKHAGLKTPKYVLVEMDADPEAVAYEVVRSFHQPVVVKPLASGPSVGVQIVGGFADVQKAVNELLQESDVLIEEYIRGVEATAGVVEGMRGEVLYSLPPIEIIQDQQICPGRFSKDITNQLMQQARTMHESLGLRHYSHSDFIVSPTGIYYLETNTLPGLTRQSLFPKSLEAVGIPLPEFLTHLIELAQSK